MPANLPPDYYAAERRFREASSIAEKIEILREMLAIMPKHKGTEHLQGDLRRKIAKLQSQAQKKQVKSRFTGLDYVPREGAGQVALVGCPNSGKSSIVAGLTQARVEVTDYPFSTFKPVPGMMDFEDVQVQLVDLPPISRSYTVPWIFNLLRLVDLVLLVVDLSVDRPEEQVFEIYEVLEAYNILLRREGDKRPQGAVAVKPTLLVGTKMDAGGVEERRASLLATYGEDFPHVFVSVEQKMGLDVLRKAVFQGLHVIRIYTKIPGKKADAERPYVLSVGSTVADAASTIHKDLADTMTFARIWGSKKYDGQRVERDHVVQDGDIIEIHTR